MTREEFEKSIGWPWMLDHTGHRVYDCKTNQIMNIAHINEHDVISAMRFYLAHYDEAQKENTNG